MELGFQPYFQGADRSALAALQLWPGKITRWRLVDAEARVIGRLPLSAAAEGYYVAPGWQASQR